MWNFGYMARMPEGPESVRSDYNGFWYQPMTRSNGSPWLNDDSDDMVFNAKVATLYKGDDGMKKWRDDTGNDTHSLVGEPDFVTYKGAAGWTSRPATVRRLRRPAGQKEGDLAGRLPPWASSAFKGKGESGADMGIRFPQ